MTDRDSGGTDVKNINRKDIIAQYKEREIIGCVFTIKNTLNNKLLLDASTDLQSVRNRFEFAQKTGSCINPKLQKDWSDNGNGVFVLEILEELRKGSSHTDACFKADVDFLKETWFDKLSKSEELY